MIRTLLLWATLAFIAMAHPSWAQAVEDSADAYRIGPGDSLQIDVYDEASVSGKFLVNQAGQIEMPVLGAVPVAGLTVAQVTGRLTRKLGADFLVDPQVAVQVAAYGSQEVQVLGAVRNPGVYPLSGPTTLLDLLAQVGGPTDKSSRTVQVSRARTGEVEPLTVNLDRLMSAGEGNILLQDGDLVRVPESELVYVSGELGKPGAVAWRDGMTVTQAITAAGGASATADLRKVYLLRGDRRQRVNVKRILKGREPDISVRAGDQLYVDKSVF